MAVASTAPRMMSWRSLEDGTVVFDKKNLVYKNALFLFQLIHSQEQGGPDQVRAAQAGEILLQDCQECPELSHHSFHFNNYR